MKQIFNTIVLNIAAMMLLSVSGGYAQTVAPGPYYAKPSWDQTLPCDSVSNCPRFIVLSNMNKQAVLDRETGLVWEQAPVLAGFSWSQANIHCNLRAVGNRRGWRLPTVQELTSLIDPSRRSAPTLPSGHPFNVTARVPYWSATSSGTDASQAYWIAFDPSLEDNIGPAPKGFEAGTLCVRGWQGTDSQ